jgi:two-component system chemotaxis response regulator CheB
MARPELVVLGASAGGVEALSRVVAGLPAGFPAALGVVLHVPPTAPSVLPQILTRAGRLPAVHPVDGDLLKPGHIYIAPPDRHLLVTGERLRVSRGPSENGHRPAIDVLFRSAARAHGPRAVGVVLTGADDDGTEGLLMIKTHGGVALVQDPTEALFDRMPGSAIRHVQVDAVLRLDELAAELDRLVNGREEGSRVMVGGATVAGQPDPEQDLQRVEREIDAWERGEPTDSASGFSCPLCGGGIWQATEGPLMRFRCHTGHVYSPESFANGQGEVLESTLWHALRLLNERIALLRQFAGGAGTGSQATFRASERYAEQADELERGVALLRELLQRNGMKVASDD